jgi:hypothetical protein
MHRIHSSPPQEKIQLHSAVDRLPGAPGKGAPGENPCSIAGKEDPANVESAVHDTMDAVHVSTEVAGSFGISGNSGALKSSGFSGLVGKLGLLTAAGTLVTGAYFGVTGARDLKKGIQEKNPTLAIEGGGHTLLAGEALIDTAQAATLSSTLRSMIGPAATAIIRSPIVRLAGTTLGVVHGAAETIVGAKEMYDGYKAKDRSHFITGLLDFAMGVSVAAIALGAGPVVGVGLAAACSIQLARLHFQKHHT